MKSYSCRVCGSPLFFENSVCVSCGTSLGYSRDEAAIVALSEAGAYLDAAGVRWFVCCNLVLSGCTWLTRDAGGQCSSCDLTRTRPHDADLPGLAGLIIAERAKRQLIVELDRLGFRLVRGEGEGAELGGICFDLLSSTEVPVVIGHQEGVITIDLAEGDPVYRERVRDSLAEPYRTMLGHFRHEIGHFIQWRLVREGERLERARELFGDETADYAAAIERHYGDGPPSGWEERYLSTYATMHPWEDFAETWAHYLHICDAVETAGEYGLSTPRRIEDYPSFADLVGQVWIPLSTALNMMSRSIGKDDLYPFVLPAPVLDKLEFVAGLRPTR